MKIELKKISYHAGLSEETNAYTADLWVDGLKIGVVSNAGHGGCDGFQGDYTSYSIADEWCKNNTPRLIYDGQDLGPSNLEVKCGDILESYLLEKALKAKLRTKVLTFEGGKVMQTGFRGCRKIGEEHIEHVKGHAPAGTVILNSLPLADALAIYAANT